MKVDFLNINGDEGLDPEIKPVPQSSDAVNKPPSYCLPWIEATRYSIQLKANFEYFIRKSGETLEACAVQDGKILPVQELYLSLPPGTPFMPKDDEEKDQNKISVGHTPAFSSPWQKKKLHSVTLKLGICWWTPPGWGLFFASAVHRNESFRIVEGYVRTDLWHRDVPIIVQPLEGEIRIPKYSVVASALLLPAESVELQSVALDSGRAEEIARQTSFKRMNESYYKILLEKKRRD